MSKKTRGINTRFKFIKKVGDISEYELTKNGLRILYKHIPDTKVITTNITYLVGARDEQPGETGVAHMLEHMLFKPTLHDLKGKRPPAAMDFEREVGVILNANTWKDRTTYFFSYGQEHFKRAIKIEAERMRDVVLTDKEFQPERTNVLSEFDMYNGDPHFALSVALACTAFYSHPYGHETIGFREDIEAYTTEKLQRFYNHFYRPNNATLMVIGDIDLKTALAEIYEHFSAIEAEPNVNLRPVIVEPKQEGIRRIEIQRPGTTNILAIAVKQPGFPSAGWFETSAVFKLLADGPDSVLSQKLIDTGLASNISFTLEPGRDTNIAVLFITLTKKTSHVKMEALVLKIITELDDELIKKQLKTIVTRTIVDEIFKRDSSLNIAAELTEFVAALSWPAYFETEKTLRNITPKDIKGRIKEIFTPSNLTIGTYKSF